MPPLLDLLTQTALQTALAPQTPEEHAAWVLRVTQAYARLAIMPDFQIILEAFVLTVLLKPCQTPEEEGARRFVLQLLEAVGNAMRYEQRLQGLDLIGME